jgi:hypothetical protein
VLLAEWEAGADPCDPHAADAATAAPSALTALSRPGVTRVTLQDAEASYLEYVYAMTPTDLSGRHAGLPSLGAPPMEQLAPQTYCQRAALELAALIRYQRKPTGKVRHDSALLRRCVEQLLASGPEPERLRQGPWEVGTKPLKRPGRGGLRFIPYVKRGSTVVMTTTPREAEELVAFLNYCGMQEFG